MTALKKTHDENVCFSVKTSVAEVDTIWDSPKLLFIAQQSQKSFSGD